MITILCDNCNTISQEIYNSLIEDTPIHSLSCSCGHSGGLTKHAYYRRTVHFHGDSVSLSILRLICSSCGSTHALLPAFLVPYSLIPLADQLDIIKAAPLPTTLRLEAFRSVMDRNPLLDESRLRYILHRFYSFWCQRLLSASISLFDEHLSSRCLLAFSRQFMQIKSTRNSIFFQPT